MENELAIGALWQIRPDAPAWAQRRERIRRVEVLRVWRRFSDGDVVTMRPARLGREPGRPKVLPRELFLRLYGPEAGAVAEEHF